MTDYRKAEMDMIRDHGSPDLIDLLLDSTPVAGDMYGWISIHPKDIGKYPRGARCYQTEGNPIAVYETATEALYHQQGTTLLALVRFEVADYYTFLHRYDVRIFSIQEVYDVYPAMNYASVVYATYYVANHPEHKAKIAELKVSAEIYLARLSYLYTAPDVFMPDYAATFMQDRYLSAVKASNAAMDASVAYFNFHNAITPQRPINKYGAELFWFMFHYTNHEGRGDVILFAKKYWIPIPENTSYETAIRMHLKPHLEDYYGND